MSWLQGIKGKVQQRLNDEKKRKAEERRIYDEEYQKAKAQLDARKQRQRVDDLRARARAKATAPGLLERGVSAAKEAARKEMREMSRPRPAPSAFDMWGFPTEQTRQRIQRLPKKTRRTIKRKKPKRRAIRRRPLRQPIQPRPESIYDYL